MVDQYGRWYPDYPGQQPYQDPQYMRAVGQPVQNHQQMMQPQNQAQNSAQDMIPTIHAEIKQVDSIEAIDRVPMAAGTSQMFMTKDESAIVIRSMLANGQHSDEIYDKRPPAPPAPKFDPADYVRKDEMDKIVKDSISAYISSVKQAKEEK